MGRKTNSNSLRIKKTNKDYNDCWYGDILYSAHFSRSLKIQKSLSNSLNTADISSPKYSLIGAQKRADVLLCYLDPKIRKQGCDKYNIKFHASISKNFCVKKKKDQNVTSVTHPISSLGHIEHDAFPTLLNSNQWLYPSQGEGTWGLACKSNAKYTQEKQQSIFTRQTFLAFTDFLKEQQKGLCFHIRTVSCGSQNPAELEGFFFPAIANTPYNTNVPERTKVPFLHGSYGGPTLKAKVCLLSPQQNKKDSQCEDNNILTFKDVYSKAPGTTTESGPKAAILNGYYSNKDIKKPLQGKNFIKPTEYLQKPFSPHLQSSFFEKKSKKSPFFRFLMGICAFRKNSYITGKNLNFWPAIADTTIIHKQKSSCVNNIKHYFPLQDIKKGILTNGAEKEYACYASPIKALFTTPDCAVLTPLHRPFFLNKTEKQAYIWNLSHCYADFWGSFLSLCFIKSNNEKASAHFLCCYVSYFLERKVLFRTIKQQLLASLNPSTKKKNRNKALTSKSYDDHTAFFSKNKSKIAGIRISCSGRVGGRSKKAQRSRKDTFMWGETGLHVFSRRLDFAKTTAETAFGAVGIQAWICYKG